MWRIRINVRTRLSSFWKHNIFWQGKVFTSLTLYDGLLSHLFSPQTSFHLQSNILTDFKLCKTLLFFTSRGKIELKTFSLSSVRNDFHYEENQDFKDLLFCGNLSGHISFINILGLFFFFFLHLESLFICLKSSEK